MSRTLTRSASGSRAESRKGSPASGTRAARSPSSTQRRALSSFAGNSLDANFEDETSPASAGVLQVRPEPVASATLAAAEEL